MFTGAVLYPPRLWHSYLAVDDGLSLQDVLVVTILGGRPLARPPTGTGPTSTALRRVDLGEDSRFVKQRQVALKVKVCAEAFVHAVAKALAVFVLCQSAATLHPVLLGCGLTGAPAARRP